MANTLAVVKLAHMSGKPEDRIINTFAFSTASGTLSSTEAGSINTALQTFYNTVPTGGVGAKVAQYFSKAVDRRANAAKIDLYDVSAHIHGEPHGSPIYSYTFTVAAQIGATVDLPAELSIVGSFHADYGNLSEEVGGERPKSRRRGRIYIGPLSDVPLNPDATTYRVGVSQNVRTTIAQAMLFLMLDPQTTWCVWSRVNGEMWPVLGGFVDDAWDIQRRRGEKALTRTTF